MPSHLVVGAVSEANSMAEIGEEAMQGAKEFNLGEAVVSEGTIAADGVKEVSTFVKFGRFASRALVVLAVLATIGGLIYEGVEGKKQMDKCQKYVPTRSALIMNTMLTAFIAQMDQGTLRKEVHGLQDERQCRDSIQLHVQDIWAARIREDGPRRRGHTGREEGTENPEEDQRSGGSIWCKFNTIHAP